MVVGTCMGGGCTASNQGNKPSDLGLGATSVPRFHAPPFPLHLGEWMENPSAVLVICLWWVLEVLDLYSDTHSMTSLADVARFEGEREDRFC